MAGKSRYNHIQKVFSIHQTGLVWLQRPGAARAVSNLPSAPILYITRLLYMVGCLRYVVNYQYETK